MKSILLSGALMASGLLVTGAYAADHKDGRTVLSYDERIALETSSPRVHVEHMYQRHQKPSDRESKNNGYRVTKDKTTINAFVPYGK